MDGKKEAIEDIRSLFSMDPDDPAFKAAWRKFKEKRGAGGLITPMVVRQRAKIEATHCSELVLDLIKGCRQVAVDEKATSAERIKAAELAVMLLKAHENLDKRLAALVDWKGMSQKKEQKTKEEPIAAAKSEIPRYYVENAG